MSILERAFDKLRKEEAPPRNSGSHRLPANTGTPRPATESVSAAVKLQPAHHVQLSADDLRGAGLAAPADLDDALSSEFRRIRRPLLSNIDGPNQLEAADRNLVMVTSAVAGDGKTFVSLNLARSIARSKDFQVLLIDADVPKRDLTTFFGLGESQGLSDLLREDGITLDEITAEVNIDGESMFFVPAGRRSKENADVLGTRKLEPLLRELSAHDRHCVVIIDSPPVLASHEGQVLAERVGQIAFVVKAGVTPRAAVSESLALLGGAKAVNLILNERDDFMGPELYGEYYAYDR